jgi:polysaccharide pyruvyl transferase WcaK-like protein
VHSLLPTREVFETVDVALFMNYVPRVKVNTETFTVGINPSGLLWRGGYTGKNEFGLKDDYQKTLRTVIEYLLAKKFAIEFIGHDVSGPHGGTRCDDYYVCKLLQREYPQCSVGPFFYGPAEAKSYISGFDLLLGSRMHCCIAAYSSGVPVLPLGYSRKFTGLFQDALKYPHLADLVHEETPRVIERLAELLQSHATVKTELMQSRKKQIRDWESTLVEDLAGKLKCVLGL